MIIAVSGIGKRNAFLQLLKREALEFGVQLLGLDALSNPPAKIGLENFLKLPYAADPEFVDKLLDILHKVKPIGFMTLNDNELRALANNRIEDRVPKLTNLLHPSSSAIQVCDDKFEFAQVCENMNIPHFNTSLYPLSEYPQICKDRYGSAASGFRVFQDKHGIDKIKEVDNLVFQKYSTGVHYCVDAYFSLKNRKLIDFCVKEVLLKSNGESFLLKSVEPDKFLYLMRLVEASLGLRGIVNLDIYEENEILRIMEVNTRVGGNYPASHKFGCNLLEHLLRELTEEKPVDVCQSHYRVGVTIAKYFDFVEAT